jgi:hypothetical protein
MQILLVLFQIFNSGGIAAPPSITGAGGPDVYGYRWIDSDTIGGPTYNWIEIKGVGTQVTGLADDNVVGPFSVGFDFPYYWYTVNSFFIGSNGYIAFGDNGMEAHPFQTLPSATAPNNMLAILLSDIDFTPGGTAWIWHNAALDTFVFEVDSVQFWGAPTSLNTFEIILTRADSALTYQYKVQNGTPGGGTDFLTVGLENISGTVGLQYLHDASPAGNTLHASLAIRYYPPATTSYQVHDIAVWNVMSSNSGGFFVYNADTANLWARIKNTGNQSESNFNVYCQVRNSSNAVVFADTVNVASLAPGAIDSLAFTPGWTPTANGQYTVKVKSLLSGDMTHSNDSILVESRVVTYPAVLAWDKGTYETSMYWNGANSGWGNYFIPPVYPVRITQGRIHFGAAAGGGLQFRVLDDDGANGMPGTVLFDSLTNPADTGWLSVNLTNHNFIISSGGFYIGGISQQVADPSFSMDTIPPFSKQGWEFTGSWAPHRDNARMDIGIRAAVELWTGTVSETNPPVRGPEEVIIAHPNPFRRVTNITPAQGIRSIAIYDALGRLVCELPVKKGIAQWNGRDRAGNQVNPGVYFGLTGQNGMLKLILTD